MQFKYATEFSTQSRHKLKLYSSNIKFLRFIHTLSKTVCPLICVQHFIPFNLNQISTLLKQKCLKQFWNSFQLISFMSIKQYELRNHLSQTIMTDYKCKSYEFLKLLVNKQLSVSIQKDLFLIKIYSKLRPSKY